jgi:hypothetical protein
MSRNPSAVDRARARWSRAALTASRPADYRPSRPRRMQRGIAARLSVGGQLVRLVTTLIVIALMAAVIGWKDGVNTQAFLTGGISVIDGDTIRSGGHVYRLVGFDTPEVGSNARCDHERQLADNASRRLRDLVTAGDLNLTRVPCACRPGTEGTSSCNHGRLCATLTARGRDVGVILMGEGLAQTYICNAMSCPPRPSWCG